MCEIAADPRGGLVWSRRLVSLEDAKASFATAVKAEMRLVRRGFIESLDPRTLAIVDQATEDLAGLAIELITAMPAQRARIENEIRLAESTLASEAALAAVNARAQIKRTITGVLMRTARLFLAVGI